MTVSSELQRRILRYPWQCGLNIGKKSTPTSDDVGSDLSHTSWYSRVDCRGPSATRTPDNITRNLQNTSPITKPIRTGQSGGGRMGDGGEVGAKVFKRARVCTIHPLCTVCSPTPTSSHLHRIWKRRRGSSGSRETGSSTTLPSCSTPARARPSTPPRRRTSHAPKKRVS